MQMMNGKNMIGTINGALKAYKIRQCARGFMKGLLVGVVVALVLAGAFAMVGGMVRGDRGFRRRAERTERDARELFGNLREFFR